jgi:hypothetical protein
MEQDLTSAASPGPSKQEILQAGNDEIARFHARQRIEKRRFRGDSLWLLKVFGVCLLVLIAAFSLAIAYQHHDTSSADRPASVSR